MHRILRLQCKLECFSIHLSGSLKFLRPVDVMNRSALYLIFLYPDRLSSSLLLAGLGMNRSVATSPPLGWACSH